MVVDFAERLRARRGQLGLTQRAVAEALGVDPTTISLYEKGHINQPSSERLERLAMVLALSLDEVRSWLGLPSLAKTQSSALEEYLNRQRLDPELGGQHEHLKNLVGADAYREVAELLLKRQKNDLALVVRLLKIVGNSEDR